MDSSMGTSVTPASYAESPVFKLSSDNGLCWEKFSRYTLVTPNIRNSVSNKGQSLPSTSFQFQFSLVILPIDGTGVTKNIIK
jgi:hypothetical protein